MVRTVSRNGQEYYLRPLRTTDVDRLLSFIVGLSPESRRLFRPHAFTRDDAVRATREAQSEHSTRLVLVRLGNDAVVGYGYFTEAGVADPRVPLLGIAIADRQQNVGLGRLLMQTLIEEARAQGKTGLQLTVYKENARAIHVYEKLGFRVVGEADGGKQHAMRLDFALDTTVLEQRGVLLNLVPWGLTHLTLDTWTLSEWTAYLDFLHAAGANLVQVQVWPSLYYHPDEPATLPHAWRYTLLRQALAHARALGMKTQVGFFLNGVPACTWQDHPDQRAVEVGYRGLGLCWSRARAEIDRFPAFLMDALCDSVDGFVLGVAGPAFCACADCRGYAAVVEDALAVYRGLLSGRGSLQLNLTQLDTVEHRVGGGLAEALAPTLAREELVVVDTEDLPLRARLHQAGIPFLAYEAGLDTDSACDAVACLPRPRLRQVDRLVAQNRDVTGVLGQRIMPRTQFATDFLLLQKLLYPARANHEILRDLGSRLYRDPEQIFDFARAVWALDLWWESGRRSDLADARDGLSLLPADRLGLVASLRDAVQLLFELNRYLEGGERHFDALVTRLHARMADSPLFQGYTIDHVWQSRANTVVAARVGGWLDMLREHRAKTAP